MDVDSGDDDKDDLTSEWEVNRDADKTGEADKVNQAHLPGGY